MGHLRVVLQIIKQHLLFSKYNNCESLLRLVAFICHVISSEGVEVDPKKSDALRNCPRPLALMDIRSFLRLAKNYMRFVDCFASIISPFTFMTQKNVKLECLETFGRTFKTM